MTALTELKSELNELRETHSRLAEHVGVSPNYLLTKYFQLGEKAIKEIERLNIMEEVNKWIQKGYEIKYDIIDQVSNGYLESVLSGDMPSFTYTFTIHESDDELFSLSVDTLEDGYREMLKFLKENNYK